MSMGRTCKFFGFYISYTILTLPLSIFHLSFMLFILCTFPVSYTHLTLPTRDVDSFLCVFLWAWAVHFLDCKMKYKSCQRLLGMCLTYVEAEQISIVLNTHKGAAQWEELWLFGHPILTIHISETRRNDLGPMKVLWSATVQLGWVRWVQQGKWLYQFFSPKNLKEHSLTT